MIQTEVCDACKAAGKTDPRDCNECIKLHVAYAESLGKESPIKTFNLLCTYYASDNSTIELPLYTEWSDIEEWHVKWNVFHYRLRGEDIERAIGLNGDSEIADQKRPVSVSVYDEDYAQEIDSTS